MREENLSVDINYSYDHLYMREENLSFDINYIIYKV
jgi:hypothetical protein